MHILTITGPSCSGKTTLLKKLVDEHGFGNVVSHTTRPMRPGEIEGRDYHFVSHEEFQRMDKADELAESVNFSGYFYGVSKAALQAASDSAKEGDVALIVEPHGLDQILGKCRVGSIKATTTNIYLDGPETVLIARYLKRLVGEDLAKTAYRHAMRLSSISDEKDMWPASFADRVRVHKGENRGVQFTSYDDENEQEVLEVIFEQILMDKNQWLK